MPEARDVVSKHFDGPHYEPEQLGERHALVIGIEKYQDAQTRDLRYAKADARVIHEILIDPELGRFAPTGRPGNRLARSLHGADSGVGRAIACDREPPGRLLCSRPGGAGTRQASI